jgi:hypothetical protein
MQASGKLILEANSLAGSRPKYLQQVVWNASIPLRMALMAVQ